MSDLIPTCPYCGKVALFVDSKRVYSKSYGYIYLCEPCDAYVGCHKSGDLEGIALGTLANKETRRWRQRAHEMFDPLWEKKMVKDKVSKKKARTAAYKWLAAELGIEYRRCHISQFQVDECRQVTEICSPYYN